MNEKVNEIFFFNYLESHELEVEEKEQLIRLYKNYVLVEKIKKQNPMLLTEYETSIYTVNNKIIPEERKIEIEIKKINKKIEELDKKELQNEIQEVMEYFEYSKEDTTILNYIKKRISLLQAKLGINNTFLEAAYNIFIEKYINICKQMSSEDNNYNDTDDKMAIKLSKEIDPKLR